MYDINRLRQYIPNGDGYNSDFAHDLSDAADEIECLEQKIKDMNEKLHRASALKFVQKKERERCAKICSEYIDTADGEPTKTDRQVADTLAKLIINAD